MIGSAIATKTRSLGNLAICNGMDLLIAVNIFSWPAENAEWRMMLAIILAAVSMASLAQVAGTGSKIPKISAVTSGMVGLGILIGLILIEPTLAQGIVGVLSAVFLIVLKGAVFFFNHD